MRISDWSSDVCSSDLGRRGGVGLVFGLGCKRGRGRALGDRGRERARLGARLGTKAADLGKIGLGLLNRPARDQRFALAAQRGNVVGIAIERFAIEPDRLARHAALVDRKSTRLKSSHES